MTVRLADSPQTGRGRVVWQHPDRTVDAALVKIIDGGWRAPRLGRLRWGRLTGQSGRVRCAARGFPRMLREPDGGRVPEQLTGHVNPGTGTAGHRYDVHVADSPPEAPVPAGEPSPWSGLSGAGLFAAGLLIGVLVIRTAGFAERRLTAVPVGVLAADSGFRVLVAGGGPLPVESVELTDLFQRPVVRPDRSPASLLRAEREAVGFYGRHDELAGLESWCTDDEDTSVQVIVGPGGRARPGSPASCAPANAGPAGSPAWWPPTPTARS